MSRVARSTWNYLTSALTQALTLVISLWATRWILRWLGDERVGAFRASADWLGYLTLLELGFSGALMPLIARAINRSEPERLSALIAEGFRTYRRVALAMVFGGLVFLAIIPWLVPVRPELVRDLRLAVLIGTSAAVLWQFAPLRPLWEADQRGYIVNLVLAVQSVVIIAGSLLLARAEWGIAGQQLAASAGLLVYTLVLLWQTLRRHPQVLKWMFMPGDAAARQEIWQLNWPTLAINTSGRLSLLTDNIVIAYFLAPAAVVPFFFTQRLIQIAAGQLQSIGNATWAGLAQLHHTGEHELFARRVQELTRLTVILGVAVLVPIAVYNATFITLWLGRERFAGQTLTTLAAVNALLLAVSSLWGWLFSGTGLTARLAPLAMFSAIVNLVLSVGLTAIFTRTSPRLALLGPVMGTTIALGAINGIGLPLLIWRDFHVRLGDLATATLVPIAAALPYGLAVALLAHVRPPRGWIGLSVQMAAASLAFLLAAFFVLLPRRERELWQVRARLARARPGRTSPASDPASRDTLAIAPSNPADATIARPD